MSQRRLKKAINLFDLSKADQPQRIPGLLGITTRGEETVDIPSRPGYVWVRLRANVNEIIQAFNETTSPVYGLPVFVERDPLNHNRYRVVSRDVGLYSDWGTASPFLANHALTHSFVEGGGADVTWVYGQQFMPGNVTPSGSFGSGNVIVYPYPYFFADNWHYAGGTGSSDLLASKPSGASNARIVLIYLDATDGNPKLIEGSEFDASITGTAAIIPYVPGLGDPTTQIPLAAIRLVTGTSSIRWPNIYDLKPYYSVSASGTAGGAASSGLLYVSGNDSTLGYLENKLAAGTGIQLTVQNEGGNENILITNTGDSGPTGTNTFLGLSDTPASYVGEGLSALRVNAISDALEFADFPIGPTGTVKVSANDTTDKFLQDKLSAGTNITLSIVNEGADEQVRITAATGGGATTTFSGARVYRVSPATGTPSSWNEIDFDVSVGATNYDTDNYFPTGTPGAAYFTIPESGYYRIVGQLYTDNHPTGTFVKAGLWLNETADLIAETTDGYPDGTNQGRTYLLATDYYLDAADTIRIRFFCPDDVTFETGTSRTYMQIGKLEPPSNFSGVRLYRDATQTINNATGTAVQWTDEKYDTDAYFTIGASSTRVNYGTSGYYNITAQVEWEQNSTGYRWAYLLLNGTDIIAESTAIPAPASDKSMLVSTDWLMSQDDYVELWVWQNSGGNTTIRGQDPAGETDGSETYLVSHYLGAS